MNTIWPDYDINEKESRNTTSLSARRVVFMLNGDVDIYRMTTTRTIKLFTAHKMSTLTSRELLKLYAEAHWNGEAGK